MDLKTEGDQEIRALKFLFNLLLTFPLDIEKSRVQ